mgnify:CR=1 FL=1
MRYLFLALAIILTSVSASAEGRNGLTVGLGTLGIEGIYTRNLNSWFDLVLGFSSLNYDDTFSHGDGTSFEASATIEAPRIGLQFFPLRFLNMEVGVVTGAPELGIKVSPDENGNYMIGDTEYPSEGDDGIGTFVGKVSFENDTAPYVLFGIGRNVGGGLGLSLSAGVIQYGSPTADLTNEKCNVLFNPDCGLLAIKIAEEERDINNDLDEFELWPFLRVGLNYSF